MEIIECIIPTKNKPKIYELRVGRIGMRLCPNRIIPNYQ